MPKEENDVKRIKLAVVKRESQDKRKTMKRKMFGNLRNSGWDALLVFAVVLGTFLRLYRLEENLVFHGELGHNYLAIKDFIIERTVPLLGPPTSHPWLAFGPLYYWIMAPIMVLARFDPRAGSLVMAFLSSAALVLAYGVLRRLFNKRIATLSTFLMAISPAWISLAREARFYSLVPLLFFPF